jgi:hypothetical protein
MSLRIEPATSDTLPAAGALVDRVFRAQGISSPPYVRHPQRGGGPGSLREAWTDGRRGPKLYLLSTDRPRVAAQVKLLTTAAMIEVVADTVATPLRAVRRNTKRHAAPGSESDRLRHPSPTQVFLALQTTQTRGGDCQRAVVQEPGHILDRLPSIPAEFGGAVSEDVKARGCTAAPG